MQLRIIRNKKKGRFTRETTFILFIRYLFFFSRFCSFLHLLLLLSSSPAAADCAALVTTTDTTLFSGVSAQFNTLGTLRSRTRTDFPISMVNQCSLRYVVWQILNQAKLQASFLIFTCNLPPASNTRRVRQRCELEVLSATGFDKSNA